RVRRTCRMNSPSPSPSRRASSSATTIAAGIARFCRGVRAPLPAEVEERACLCLADHLHAAMRGAASESATRLRGYIGKGDRGTFAEPLALLLGAASTVHEIDDVHQDTSLHTGSAVVPAALACLA